MKGKSKQQKGITLIALIITIVVLLILAVVAIDAIQDDGGILAHAQNAAGTYNNAVANEQMAISEYLSYLEKNDGKIGDATVGTKVIELSTINGQQYTANNPVIPAGFMPINTPTSNWDATDLAAEVKKGLVISDGKSEFVWIPVANISEMAKETGKGANGRTNYEGVLYNFSGTTATEKSSYGQSTTSYREPVNLSSYDTNANLSIWTETLYQESFNKMVESVAKYKGFYVGRYEMSYNETSGKAESAAEAITATSSTSSENNWFGLYQKARTYSTRGVISEMIWGCQYDAMLRWMQSNGVNVNDGMSPYDPARGEYVYGNNSDVTGPSGNRDIINNIHDYVDHCYEFTQEALNEDLRICRSDYYGNYMNPAGRHDRNGGGDDVIAEGGSVVGTRLTLYIEM